MATGQKQKGRLVHSMAFKGTMIAVMAFVMLIPGCMVQGLISERQATRNEAIRKIDSKWSYAQTICGPILAVPYTVTYLDANKKQVAEERIFHITSDTLDIKTQLFPEERHYGIYKTILYKSIVEIEGVFSPMENVPNGVMHWDRAYLKFGVSDLRGISENITFQINDSSSQAQVGGGRDNFLNEVLCVDIENYDPKMELNFSGKIQLKGSESINFLPVGRTTNVTVVGDWSAPGFVGNYTPEYALDDNGFEASWRVLSFNRNIPDAWSGDLNKSWREVSFGVNLVDTVDIYQLNMRSAKYALMFIALTFVVFFFVEVISRKRIHMIHYVLVGVALILFYSLLLSISEPLGFGWAYLISSIATIGLITAHATAIFKNRKQTIFLSSILVCLYAFLYIILQLESMALLAGSVGLFIILGVIMHFAKRINWDKVDNVE